MRVNRTPVAVAGMILALLVGAPDAMDAQTVESHTLGGSAVAIYNLAGKVTIGRGSGSDVVVRIARGGEDAGRLRVVSGRVGGRETLRVIYPEERIVYRALGEHSTTEVRVDDDGTFYDDHSGRGRRIRISGTGSGLDAHADLDIAIPAGRELALYLAVGEVVARNVQGDLLLDVGSAPVTTEGTRGRLSIDAGSGHVRVRDAEGDLELDTGSGGVELTNVRGRRVLLDTGSGGITGTGISAPTLLFDTGSGGLRLTGVTSSSIDLDTGSGRVELELLSDIDDLRIDSGSGGVTLRVPESLGAEIEIDTSSGGIDIDVSVTLRRYSRSYVSGTIGDGRGRIVIDTGSGGVRIVRR